MEINSVLLMFILNQIFTSFSHDVKPTTSMLEPVPLATTSIASLTNIEEVKMNACKFSIPFIKSSIKPLPVSKLPKTLINNGIVPLELKSSSHILATSTLNNHIDVQTNVPILNTKNVFDIDSTSTLRPDSSRIRRSPPEISKTPMFSEPKSNNCFRDNCFDPILKITERANEAPLKRMCVSCPSMQESNSEECVLPTTRASDISFLPSFTPLDEKSLLKSELVRRSTIEGCHLKNMLSQEINLPDNILLITKYPHVSINSTMHPVSFHSNSLPEVTMPIEKSIDAFSKCKEISCFSTLPSSCLATIRDLYLVDTGTPVLPLQACFRSVPYPKHVDNNIFKDNPSSEIVLTDKKLKSDFTFTNPFESYNFDNAILSESQLELPLTDLKDSCLSPLNNYLSSKDLNEGPCKNLLLESTTEIKRSIIDPSPILNTIAAIKPTYSCTLNTPYENLIPLDYVPPTLETFTSSSYMPSPAIAPTVPKLNSKMFIPETVVISRNDLPHPQLNPREYIKCICDSINIEPIALSGISNNINVALINVYESSDIEFLTPFELTAPLNVANEHVYPTSTKPVSSTNIIPNIVDESSDIEFLTPFELTAPLNVANEHVYPTSTKPVSSTNIISNIVDEVSKLIGSGNQSPVYLSEFPGSANQETSITPLGTDIYCTKDSVIIQRPSVTVIDIPKPDITAKTAKLTSSISDITSKITKKMISSLKSCVKSVSKYNPSATLNVN